MSKIAKIEDAFFNYTKKGSFAALLFWSRDWFSMKPWTYEGKPIYYIDYKLYEREIGYMYSVFIGPLCIVYYKMK